MRIADKMNYDQTTSNLAKNRSDMSELQNQAATQKRLTKPSDDPLGTTQVLAARTEISGGAQFLKNINQAKAFLEYSDQSLGELSEALVRAKELALGQASDGGGNEKSRKVVATEVQQLFQQSVQVGNRKLGDRFLFGGFRTTKPPFGVDGKYFGDDGEIQVRVAKEANVAMNIPGSQAFLGKDPRQSIQFSAPLEFETVGSNPESKGKVDSTGGAANSGYSGKSAPQTVAPPVEQRGPASFPANSSPGLNSGANAQAQSAEENQFSESANGPRDRRRIDNNLGSSWQTDGTNVFEVLSKLEIALNANDKGGIQDSIDRLDEAIAQVVLARSRVGARVMTLNSATESLQKGQVDAKTMASNIEDADTFELVSDLNKTESTLKASLATSSKLIQPSLLDFLK